ncbi:MAG TPA: AsmA-like C-terminal region-containing protein, partial [Steroidobacteraceae bacterium]|nr:AsmA-like C-terminal region-containing protein [Steroidobacteraceae bacterium]
DAGELQVSCSERLRALVALTRGPDGWRIERGAVRLDATPPTLPAAPVLALDGRVGRLDLAAYLALWHEAARDAALPALTARLSAAQLVAGTRVFPEVAVTADALQGAGEVELASADLSGSLRWPAQVSEAHPAAARFADFNLTQPGDAALPAALAQLFAPALQLDVDELAWQGRSLGRLTARLAGHAGALEVSGLQLTGPAGVARASGLCTGGACSAQLSLDSHDVAATLAALGLRGEISAARGLASARLQWSPGAPSALASLDGDLHMQLEEGATRVAAAEPGMPLALLPVPALMAALGAPLPAGADPGLHFARVTAGFALHGGEATTADLHFDGDAEIMMRGRVGLVARDYDAEAVILRGEERLPAALRRLVATPRVAAAWLSLRELFGGAPAERGPAVLRLRGTWSDPIVAAAE